MVSEIRMRDHEHRVWRKSGFALIRNVFVESEIDQIIRQIEEAEIQRSRAGVRHLLRIPAISSLARDPRLIRLAAEALRAEPVPFGATLFDKSDTANWLVVWHQDTALPMEERRDAPGWGPWSTKDGVEYAHAPGPALESIVAIRLHLDPSTLENGALRILPGTHAQGVLSDGQIHSVSSSVRPVVCGARGGDVLIMRPLLLHASSKATTASSRRVVHLEYASTVEFENGLRLKYRPN